jgi:hypothetical protein
LLAGALHRARAARVGAALGREERGVLVPETALLEELEMGRFEVTRAQFSAFMPSKAFGPGEENLPATAVSFEDARGYASWLAQKTGRAFRLPTKKEAERLVEKAKRDGNTLDHWAGYPTNPEDAERIAELLENLPGDAALLLPVGSFPAEGDSLIYDLDGNAAEWVVGANGEGVIFGPSADRPADDRGSLPPPAPAYTGLRVVIGAALTIDRQIGQPERPGGPRPPAKPDDAPPLLPATPPPGPEVPPETPEGAPVPDVPRPPPDTPRPEPGVPRG